MKVGVPVGVALGVAVRVGVAVEVWVKVVVGVLVGVGLAVGVALGVFVNVGVGVAATLKLLGPACVRRFALSTAVTNQLCGPSVKSTPGTKLVCAASTMHGLGQAPPAPLSIDTS